MIGPNQQINSPVSDLIGGPLDFTINGQPINPPATEEPATVKKSWFQTTWFYEPFKYIAGATAAYVAAPIASGVMGGVDIIHTVTDDISGTWEAYATNFYEAQADVKAVTERVISGAVPFSNSFGKIFKNPLLTLGIVAAIMALWFLGPIVKRVSA